MSAPLVKTKDPRFVNTPGACWVRRAVTRDGRGLYAVEGSCGCPEYLLVPLSELAELGIVGSADVLPVPVGPEPQALTAHAASIRLAQYGERTSSWSTATYNDGTENALHEIAVALDAEAKRLRAERADEHDEVAAAVGYTPGLAWSDLVGIVATNTTSLVRAEQDVRKLRSRVTELEAERHSTNEALDDAVQALRERDTQRGDVEQLIEEERGYGEECVDIAKLEGALALGADDGRADVSADRLTRMLAPSQVLREDAAVETGGVS